MADVHRLPDDRKVLHEATAWIARLQADDVTREDVARFDVWRSAHPLHRRTFDELTSTWNRFAAQRPLVSGVAFGQSMNEVATQRQSGQRRARRWSYRAAWAAAAVGLVIGFTLFTYLRPAPGRTYFTPKGEHATVSLPDGSMLELDSDSRARVEFSTRYRIVYLERGEAYFKVIHNADWPFWVVGRGSWVKDVGTAFNVQLNHTGIRVTVSEGTVKIGAIAPLFREIPFEDAVLSHQTALSVLTAGHQASISGRAVKIRPLGQRQLAHAISWHAQTLYFENAPLSEVAAELGRYSPLHLVVSGVHLRQLPVAGTFDGSPLGVETFLTMLNQGFGLAVHHEAGEIIIERAGGIAH